MNYAYLNKITASAADNNTADFNQAINAISVSRDISPEEFLKENILKRKPILIKGALREWKALQWTPEYLKKMGGGANAELPH